MTRSVSGTLRLLDGLRGEAAVFGEAVAMLIELDGVGECGSVDGRKIGRGEDGGARGRCVRRGLYGR